MSETLSSFALYEMKTLYRPEEPVTHLGYAIIYNPTFDDFGGLLSGYVKVDLATLRSDYSLNRYDSVTSLALEVDNGMGKGVLEAFAGHYVDGWYHKDTLRNFGKNGSVEFCRYLYDPLPEKIKQRVVLKREYWITDEAQTVYAAAHSLVSMEMHSPIIFITAGKPAILLRQAEDTFKGQMWRDIGLQDWILELNVSGAEEISRHVFEIIDSYPEALRQAEQARDNAERAAAAAFRKIVAVI